MDGLISLNIWSWLISPFCSCGNFKAQFRFTKFVNWFRSCRFRSASVIWSSMPRAVCPDSLAYRMSNKRHSSFLSLSKKAKRGGRFVFRRKVDLSLLCYVRSRLIHSIRGKCRGINMCIVQRNISWCGGERIRDLWTVGTLPEIKRDYSSFLLLLGYRVTTLLCIPDIMILYI